MPLSPDELAARYDDPYRKAERIELPAERFDRGVERGDDGAWGVGALVIDAGSVLFVREGDTWLLPGGRLEAGEPPADGAAREVREETGAEIEIAELGAIAEQTFVREGSDDSYEFYFATFVGVLSGGDTTVTSAHEDAIDEVAWLAAVPDNTFDRDLVKRLVAAYR
ncbi:MAG: 8-oxo-dGTP diphosphatase [Natronomonas sp.]|jgi:8-oxo-dGTP diphosphatase|uniref:NUDIX hydrolase n=1 Tax=Natronomonas sp. TaxID=2184060 RepID=UPI0039891DDA